METPCPREHRKLTQERITQVAVSSSGARIRRKCHGCYCLGRVTSRGSWCPVLPHVTCMHSNRKSAGVEHDWQLLLNTHPPTHAPLSCSKSSEVRRPLVSVSWRRKEMTLAMAPGAWPWSLTHGPSISPAATIKHSVTETPRWITVGRHPETGASCGQVTFVKLSFAPSKGLWEGKK